MIITNLFADAPPTSVRSRSSAGIRTIRRADRVLLQAAQDAGGAVLACGGASHDFAPGRYSEVLALLEQAGIPTYAVAREPGGEPLLTRDGRPLHPRTLPGPAHAAAVPFIDD